MSRRSLVVALVLVLGSSGCALIRGGWRSEIPTEPIAMIWWEHEDARKRAELLEQAGARPQGGQLGVATAEALGALLGVDDESREQLADRLGRMPGRLALLHPGTGEIEMIPEALPGSRPLAWSPDHKRLLFSSARLTGQAQLYEFHLERREVRSLTRGPGSHALGDYGPAGALVYSEVRRVGRNLTVRVMVRDSAGGARVLSSGTPVYGLRFARDGSGVVAVRPSQTARARPGTIATELVSLPLDGGEEKVVGRGKDVVIDLAGDWMLYARLGRKNFTVVRSRPNGTGRAAVSDGRRDAVAPAISPDGRYVAYVSQAGDLERIMVRPFSGGKERVLLNDGAAAWPVW